ncbi:MAG: PTS ascorbate transporter subunit IIC [Culicoidibacterales bacterium]
MTIIITIFTWFVNNILAKPEFFIGILVFIGYVLLRKKWYESFAGFIKATVGYMILNVGAAGLVTTFRPILAGLNGRFGLNAAVIDPYFGLNAVNDGLKTLGISTSWTLIALLIGFIVNIILVLLRRYTKIRTLFITGHIMVQQATTVTWIVFLFFPDLRNIYGATIVGILAGLYWAVGANLTVGPTQRLTNNAGFAIGHQQMFAVWFADKVAGKLGDPRKNLDSLKLPKWLSMFHDTVVSSGTLMILFFGGIMLVLGEPYMREIDKTFAENISFITYIISQSLKFSVYLVILMTGVRMFVSELTASFQGISSRILPGVLPGVDCAATYNFGSPNAPLFGFVCGAIGQFLTIALLVIFGSPILIITGFVPVFFDNATIAVYADKVGGIKAAVILTFASGVLQVLGGAVAVWMFALTGGWHGNIDWSTLWPVFGALMKYLGYFGIGASAIILLAIPQLQYYFAKDKQAYEDGLE